MEIDTVIDDSKKEALFHDIAEKELKNGIDISSFDNMPFLFHGLKTSMFGFSSSIHENPFFEIKKIAMNREVSWEDRTQAVRYMQKIPHIYRDSNCIEATLSIVTDEQYPFENRFHFFSNNEKIIKLNYEIVNACHKYVYENFDKMTNKHIPLIYKILSAQHILTQFPIGTYDSYELQEFLLNIAKDETAEINYRAECADILERAGYDKYKQFGRDIIHDLGQMYTENKKRTIYTNLQNVHDTTVTKKIIDTLRQLMSTVYTERHTGEIYERIVSLTQNDSRRDSIIDSFQRILIDTSRYETLTMVDILLLVWEKICSSENRSELELRMLDELHEMDKTCSSGHLTRLMNILSGFFDEIQPVRISFAEQLRTNVFARYSVAIRTLSQFEQDMILKEMTEETDYKPTIEDLKTSLSPEYELYDEFVPTYLTEEEFNRVFSRSEKDFFGYV